MKLSAVPVVIVFTKLDVLESQSREDVDKEHPGAEQGFKDGKVNQKIEDVLRTSFIEPIREVTGKEYFPHVKVSGKNSPTAPFLTLNQTCSVCATWTLGSGGRKNHPATPDREIWAIG